MKENAIHTITGERGTAVAINPNEGASSGAGSSGASVEKNVIEETTLDVIMSDLRATAVIDGIA